MTNSFLTNSCSKDLNWWETPLFFWFITLASALPLLWPTTPPLIDVPGHMGRYAVQIGQAGENARIWYDFRWDLIGNLGVDLLVQFIAPLVGLQLAVKLIVMLIPCMQVAGFLLAAQEVHGKLPATACFAAPLAFCFPFQFGFINFSLSVALAFLALSLWVRMGKQERILARAICFVPISLIIWICHIVGLGLFGVLAFGAEIARLYNRETNWKRLPFLAAVHCLVLVAPFLLMIFKRSEAGGLHAHDWFDWTLKWSWMKMVLRDRWEDFDKASALILALPFLLACRRKGVRWSGGFLIAALICMGLFALLPRILLGSAYADMRLFPYVLVIGLLSIGPAIHLQKKVVCFVACFAVAFFVVRTVATTISLKWASDEQEQHLLALPHIPMESRLFSMIGKPCQPGWALQRNDHLPSLALVKRHAFANDQWNLPGSQLIHVKLGPESEWTHDPSQFVTAQQCRADWKSIDQVLQKFPRALFDYMWIISPPRDKKYDIFGLLPIWRNGDDVVYRIDHNAKKPAL